MFEDLTREQLETRLETSNEWYGELLGTVEMFSRVNDALAADLADAIQEGHWARAERDTLRKDLNDAETENERLRVELEKAKGEGNEDFENLAKLANEYVYRILVFNVGIVGKYAPENATFDEFADEYVYPSSDFENVGITREWFIRFFREKIEAAYEADKERFAKQKAEEEEGCDD